MELSVHEISERLAAQAQTVASFLLPGGKLINGKEWVCGDISGTPGESLKVCVFGTYAGQWRDWSTDTDKGDLIDLWRLTKDITQAQAIKEAKNWLGIVDSVHRNEPKVYAKPPRINAAALNPAGMAMQYLMEGRGLFKATIEAFKIEGCTEKKAIVFPSYNPAGELVNRSYRTLGKDKKVWQDRDCAPSLFGWQALPNSAYQDRKVLLAEGQIDAATWHQWGIPALSIPNGTGCAWIDFEWDNLACFDTFLLAFDQDEAGRKITQTVMDRLGKHKCLVVAMPCKDANECLKQDYTADDAADWVANAKAPRVKRLITAKEAEERLVDEIREKAKPFTLPFMDLNWPHSGFYFRPGEVTIWGGYTSAGKSTMLNFMKASLLAAQEPVFDASLEMKVEVMLARLARNFYGERLTEELAREFIKAVGEYLIYADIVGTINETELLEMMWFSYRRYGVRHFIIDSLMRIEGLEEDFERQGEFSVKLQKFVKETNTHVHLVAHLKKPNANAERPSMYGVKGSSLLVNNCDNVLLVARNPDKEKLRRNHKLTEEQDQMMHDAEIIIEKHRATGWLNTYKLKFNPQRYIYTKCN